jgi:glutathione S-transferase
MTPDALPVLYSFRRCPYAMRARMALIVSRTQCELREVSLKDKPVEMISASPKATVPVLVLPDGKVIDESLDIMLWALRGNDPQNWLKPPTGSLDEMLALIAATEDPFKTHLDRYKYAVRYDDTDPDFHRSEGLKFLNRLNTRLTEHRHLFGTTPALADYAIFPFVRQFANTDRPWFDAQPLPALQTWLAGYLESKLFAVAMVKRSIWKSEAMTLDLLNGIS